MGNDAQQIRALRDVLTLRRRGLVDRMVTDVTDVTGTLEQAYVAMLADTHTAIAAVDAELAESTMTGDER
jgi:hypothetical protein